MIKFGPSGNSEAFYEVGYKHTEQSAKFCKDLGLDCFEYSFGRGVLMTQAKAEQIGEAFKEQEVEISVHAPYFINFANPDDEAALKSYNYVLKSAEMVNYMGGERIVFHPAAQGKATREEAVQRTEERLKILAEHIYVNNLERLKFCPETMGKSAQIGTIEEIVRFCKIDKCFIGLDLTDPLISPLFGNYDGFPPTCIQVGENEILLSDALRLHKTFVEKNVPVKIDIYPGMWHVFQMSPIKAARAAMDKNAEFIFDVCR